MSDLIDRQAAIEAVHKEFDGCLVWDESGEYTADEVERILDDVPSVQLAQDLHSACTDTISRQAALDAIRNIRALKGTFDGEILLIDKAEAQTTLMLLPSAQPQRMRGRWIKETIVTEDEHTHSTEYSPYWKCSECGMKYSGYLASRVNFCLQCGADMRGEADE